MKRTEDWGRRVSMTTTLCGTSWPNERLVMYTEQVGVSGRESKRKGITPVLQPIAVVGGHAG